MHDFDKISIAEISKEDMLIIIKALEYTGKNTNDSSYLELMNAMMNELTILSGSNEEDFIKYLRK